ncbi:MAG: amidase [Pirellulales bacterium]|nr:amidase [Pirellulales bacterium]
MSITAVSPSHAPSEEIYWQSATELARRIRAGELTAFAVVDAHIRRIEAVNPLINAMVVPRFAAARVEAQAADDRQRRGEPLGPLHGVPISVKECFFVPGTRATIGVDALDEVTSGESVLVSRLRAAGAIVLGKTNIPQLMVMHETDNPVYGRTNNPWCVDRGPGGSSGGEAAMVAAGGVALGLGNDLGGSIRQPAHSCGICGLKTTSWRLPESGSRTNWNGMESLVTAAGPLARHVADLNLALSVLAAPGLEQVDTRIPPVAWRDPADVQLEQLTVGYWTDDGAMQPSPAIRRAVREAADSLAARGMKVVPFSPPDFAEALSIYFKLMSADGGADARRLLGSSRRDKRVAKLLMMARLPGPLRRTLGAMLRAAGQEQIGGLLGQIGGISADAYWQQTSARARYLERFQAAMLAQSIDVLLGPVCALPALRHGASEFLSHAASSSMLFNLLGYPAGTISITRVRPGEESDRQRTSDLAVRAAIDTEAGSAGMPVGVQVAASAWREDRVLAVMQALEDAWYASPEYPKFPPL